uniref:Uncharacterized protein n=1 Tax=Salix viminalis TaxID=40686 RepID=A0A6N2N2E9_SALVM
MREAKAKPRREERPTCPSPFSIHVCISVDDDKCKYLLAQSKVKNYPSPLSISRAQQISEIETEVVRYDYKREFSRPQK